MAMGIVEFTWYVELGAGASIMRMPGPKYCPFEYKSLLAVNASNSKTKINFLEYILLARL